MAADPFGSATYMLVKQEKDAQMFYSEIRKQGYNAIKDYFDAPITSGLGQIRLTDSPTILLNAIKDVKVTDIERVTGSNPTSDYYKIIRGAESGNAVWSEVIPQIKQALK